MGDNNISKDTHAKYTDAYINILNTYKDQISTSVEKKNTLKESFFITIKRIMYWLTGVFVGTLVCSLILFGIMIFCNYNSVGVVTGAITTIISSFVTMTLSIFKLPEIIADYLFNKEEDKLMKEIIQNIQQYEIDAVKYELEKIKFKRIKQINSEVNPGTFDDCLTNSVYDTPAPTQGTGNQLTNTQTENTNEENNAS